MTERTRTWTNRTSRAFRRNWSTSAARRRKSAPSSRGSGGAASAKRAKAINLIFIGAILSLFIFDALRHIYRIPLDPLPPMFSLSMGILLVSIKIVWMIHKQAKVEHFQFYVLSSIEFRLNDLSRRLSQIGRESEQDRQTRQTTS